MFHFDGEIYVTILFNNIKNRSKYISYRTLESIKNTSDEIKLLDSYQYFTERPIAYRKCRGSAFYIRKYFAKKSFIKNVVIRYFDSRNSVINEDSYIMCGRNVPCIKFKDRKFLGLNLMESEIGFRAKRGRYFPKAV